MKINAGKYGRTNKGRILVFSWLQDGNGKTMKNCVVKYVNGGVIKYWLDEDEKIVKHSKNIIDLIEVGDYVNGEKVNKNKYGELYIGYVYAGGEIGKTLEAYATFIEDIKEEYIETIVTKEQMEEMEYRV